MEYYCKCSIHFIEKNLPAKLWQCNFLVHVLSVIQLLGVFPKKQILLTILQRKLNLPYQRKRTLIRVQLLQKTQQTSKVHVQALN